MEDTLKQILEVLNEINSKIEESLHKIHEDITDMNEKLSFIQGEGLVSSITDIYNEISRDSSESLTECKAYSLADVCDKIESVERTLDDINESTKNIDYKLEFISSRCN